MTSFPKRLTESTQTEWGHSRWNALETCPRAYQFRYVNGIRTQGTRSALQRGIAVHRGLAATYWAMKNPADGVDSSGIVHAAIDAGAEPIEIKMDAVRLVVEHNRFWADRDIGFDKVIDVEKLVVGDVDGVPYTTRIDLVAEKTTGNTKFTILEDHKTASRAQPGDPATEFAMSGQLIGTVHVWQQNQKGKSKSVPQVRINKIIATKEPQFMRFGIPITETALARWRKDLVLLNKDLTRYLKAGYFPRKRTSCVGRYGNCEYLPLCHVGPAAAGEFVVPKGVDLNAAIK